MRFVELPAQTAHTHTMYFSRVWRANTHTHAECFRVELKYLHREMNCFDCVTAETPPHSVWMSAERARVFRGAQRAHACRVKSGFANACFSMCENVLLSGGFIPPRGRRRMCHHLVCVLCVSVSHPMRANRKTLSADDDASDNIICLHASAYGFCTIQHDYCGTECTAHVSHLFMWFCVCFIEEICAYLRSSLRNCVTTLSLFNNPNS